MCRCKLGKHHGLIKAVEELRTKERIHLAKVRIESQNVSSGKGLLGHTSLTSDWPIQSFDAVLGVSHLPSPRTRPREKHSRKLFHHSEHDLARDVLPQDSRSESSVNEAQQ